MVASGTVAPMLCQVPPQFATEKSEILSDKTSALRRSNSLAVHEIANTFGGEIYARRAK
jgi:hypothetical protein